MDVRSSASTASVTCYPRVSKCSREYKYRTYTDKRYRVDETLYNERVSRDSCQACCRPTTSHLSCMQNQKEKVHNSSETSI